MYIEETVNITKSEIIFDFFASRGRAVVFKNKKSAHILRYEHRLLKKAPSGFEPEIRELQSLALATWL